MFECISTREVKCLNKSLQVEFHQILRVRFYLIFLWYIVVNVLINLTLGKLKFVSLTPDAQIHSLSISTFLKNLDRRNPSRETTASNPWLGPKTKFLVQESRCLRTPLLSVE
jgi:hypothetical protein